MPRKKFAAQTKELPLDAWSRALAIAGLSKKKITVPAEGETPLDWFTGRLWDEAPGVVQTDWKESVASICESLGKALEKHRIKVEVEDDAEDPLEVRIEAAGEVQSAQLPGATKKNADQAAYMFAVAGLLPRSVEVYSLRGLEDSDSWGYLVLDAKAWQALRKLLGKEFDRAFALHKPAKIKVEAAAKQVSGVTLVKTSQGKRKKQVAFLTRDTIKKRIELGAKLAPRELKHLKGRGLRLDGAWNMPLPAGCVQKEMDRYKCAHDISRWIVTDGHTYLARSLLRVFRGDVQGYADAAGVIRGVVAAMRLEIELNDWLRSTLKSKTPKDDLRWDTLDINRSMFLLLTAVSLRQDEDVDYVFDRAMRTLRANQEEWDHTPFEPFVLRLYCRWRGVKDNLPKVKCRDQAVYQAVLDHWDHEAKFAAAIDGICDYHATHCRDWGTHAFAYSPFEFYPVELHALARMRADAGLPMPWPEDHPLLATAFGPLPPAATPVREPILEAALARCRDLSPTLRAK